MEGNLIREVGFLKAYALVSSVLLAGLIVVGLTSRDIGYRL